MHRRQKDLVFRRRGYFALLLHAILLIALGACGPSFELEPEGGEAAIGVSAAALSANNVASVTVTVSGSGISPNIVSNLAKTNGQWAGVIGSIPVGANRTFLADAYDAGNTLLYEGQVSGVSIAKGVTAAVVIVLQQKTAPTPFTNSAPKITAVTASSSQVTPGQTVSLSVTASDPDGDPLSYAWTATGGTFTSGTTATPTWTSPAADGDYTLSVSVTDGKGGQAGISLVISSYTDKGSASVTTSFNTWPVVSQVTALPGQVNAGSVAALDVTAVDPDGDAVSYAWSDGGCGGSFGNASVKSPSWTAPAMVPASGKCTLTVTVSDGKGGSTTGALVVAIGLPLVPNAPPVIDQSFQSAGTVSPGGTVSLQVSAHDPEGKAISFGWSASGGSLGAPVNTATSSQVVWTAPASGTPYAITVVVQDAAAGQATQNFSVSLPGQSGVKQVAGGGQYSMLLKTDGTLWATGRNDYGTFGDGTTNNHASFVQVLTGVASVSVGDSHTLALKTDGTLWVTGYNPYGQLGDGTSTSRTSFVQVLTGVASVTDGYHHTLALKTDGTLWATGRNDYGQLGDGTTTARTSFVQVLTGVASVAAGFHHTSALKTDGTLWATGYNPYGELGDGTTTDRHGFVQVLTGVASVAAVYQHTVAVKADGTLWATGNNGYGQLGDGTSTDRKNFVQLLTGVASVAVGYHHTVAVKTDGTLWATGRNDYGQLGDGTNTSRTSFTQVLTGVASVAAGDDHTLAVKTIGTLWTTGWNNYGQLGDGTTTDRLNFVQVPVP